MPCSRLVAGTARAFSLIESAIVLAIVGLVIGGIWVAAATVYEKLRLNTMAADSAALVESLIRNLDTVPPPPGSGDTNLANYIESSRLLPSTWTRSGNEFFFARGSSAGIGVYASIRHGSGVVTLSFANSMTPKICAALVAQLRKIRPSCINTNYASAAQLQGNIINLDVTAQDLDGTYPMNICEDPMSCYEQNGMTIEFRVSFIP